MKTPPFVRETGNHPYTLQELFSTAVLTSTLVKALALILVLTLVFHLSWYDQLALLGITSLAVFFSLLVYHLGLNLLRFGTHAEPSGPGYPLFSLALALGMLVLTRQYFTYLNALFFFPVLISTLLLGRRGMAAAFVGIIFILGLSLYYRDQLTAWHLSGNIIVATVMLFGAWLVGEVTELNRRTTRSLSQTSDFLQTVLDALPAGVFLQDRAGRITSVNRYLHQLLGGGSRGEALAEDRGTHDSARNNLETIRALAGDPKSPVQVGEIKKPDGESVPVQVSRHPVALDGEAQVILVQDLSDQQKLRELDLMLHRLLEGWDIGVVFLDAADRVRIHNEAARRYLRFDDNINGRSGVDILQRLALKAPDRDRKPIGGTETVLNDRYLLVDRAIWHKSPDGRPWTVLTIHDITERKKAELEIQRVRNLSSLGQIAAGVAHELRNPLTSIKGFAQLALEQKDLEKSKKHTEVVLRQTSHMQEILDRFLFMAKPSQPSYQVADLREIVLWVWELLYNESLHREVRLEKTLPPEALTVRVDPQLMRQVILNLVNNAFEATPPGGSVRLEAEAAGDEVHLTVTDTGSGIPAHQLDEVFVPFFTTKEKGSGLGLAISHELVRKHGGTLSVESSGSGTSFRIALPRLDPGPPAQNPQPHVV